MFYNQEVEEEEIGIPDEVEEETKEEAEE